MRPFLLVLLLAASAAHAQGLLVPQSDDALEFAVHYPAGAGVVAYTSANIDATRDANPAPYSEDPACFPAANDGDNSIWFVFTLRNPISAGQATVDLEGSTFDTMLTLFDADGTVVGCNDDDPTNPTGDRTSSLSMDVPVGLARTYVARVTGYRGAQGIVRFTLLTPGLIRTPANNDYRQQQWETLTTSGRPHYGDTAGAGMNDEATPWEVAAPCAAFDDRNDSVFWSFVAPANGSLTLSTVGSRRQNGQPLDTILSVYPQSGPGALTVTACDDDGGGSRAALIEAMPVRAGVRYAVRVSTYRGEEGGEGSVVLTPTFAPGTPAEASPNDDALALGAPAPNPTAGRTRLAFTLGAAGPARLAVVDVLGREVAVLHDGPAAAGRTEASFDASALPAGVYVARLSAAAGVRTQRVTVVR